MPDSISINKQKIGLGEQQIINLNIARLPTYTSIDLPVLVYRAPVDGPVLLLTGGLHGDEINGIEIVRRMIERELLVPDKGTVIAIPIVNIYGFIQNSRGLPDGKDINRSFPGAKGGSLAKLLAYTLMKEIIPEIDYGLDFHTGGAARSNYPQIRCSFKIKKAKELAQAFGAPVMMHSSLISKSFRSAAHKKGKEILVYETGESLRFDEFGIEEGINGAKRLMKHLGMIPEAPDPHNTKVFTNSTWIRTKNAGLFIPKADLGEELNKRQVLGLIKDPYGDLNSRVIAPHDGMVIGLNNCPVVNKGDALLHYAYNK
ncbi:MAG: succinylglutamate desuccinylase/aspartoacylase family protein [Gracilimonas sp.]|uniref:succinylglutamate desuccinylase/aspartoacylase family protein n=1 Tax=Gracilimonas sp. TaxID=1974203 RepID=UPI0037520287|nr:succinylglutamate desuccinylase/aspartoacylase family protein [Gracilimonas sp.]